MSDNKILIKLIVPELDKTYDLFIPISKKVGNIIKLVNKGLEELNNDVYFGNKHQFLYNRYTGVRYNVNSLIYETDIRNDTILILI